MNKLLGSSLALVAFTFAAACSTPVIPTDGPANHTEGAASDSTTPSSSSSSASSHADAGAPATTTTTTSGSKGSSTASAGDAGAKGASTDGKGDDDDDDTKGGKDGDTTGTADPACMTACQALSKCGDLSFCDTYCADSPAVIPCLAAAPSCTKADFVTCESQAGANGGGK